MSPASGPTPAQIAIVQTNLQNMQALNDYVYTHGQSKIMNAYSLLHQPDSSDPGLTIGLNILEGAFWAIGGSLGPIGNFAASFLSGMVAWWATPSNTPPTLGTSFSSLITRFNATSIQVDTNLATYYQNVAGNWNTSFDYNGNTTTLSDLAVATFPAETDPAFFPLANNALFALDQYIWTFLLKSNYKVTYWDAGSDFIPYSVVSDPAASASSFYGAHPAYYETWTRVQTSGCAGQNGWNMPQYSLGGSTTEFTDAALNDGSCQYLFIDSVPGTTINPDGLFTRETVFTGLNIPTATQYCSTGGGIPAVGAIDAPPPQLSVGYLRAMKEGNTLTALLQKKGRPHVQAEILAKAAADPIFSRDLVRRPRQTLEAFLGVKIAEVIDLTVIAETPASFALVLPQPDNPPSAGS
jgi:hypothetical protein